MALEQLPGTAGRDPAPEWLETEWLLSQFAASLSQARQAYVRFVLEGKGRPSIWQDLHARSILAKAFVERMRQHLAPDKDLREVPWAQRRGVAKPLEHYARSYKDRHEAMVQAYCSGRYTLRAIAEHFGVHYSTVSRAVKRHEEARQ